MKCDLSDKKNFIVRSDSDEKKIIYLLPTGTDDEVQEFDYLDAWGPRFDKLANMYGDHHPTELDELN